VAIVVRGPAANLLWCLNTTEGESRDYNPGSGAPTTVSRQSVAYLDESSMETAARRHTPFRKLESSQVPLARFCYSAWREAIRHDRVGGPSTEYSKLGHPSNFGCTDFALLSALRGTFRVAVADCCGDPFV